MFCQSNDLVASIIILFLFHDYSVMCVFLSPSRFVVWTLRLRVKTFNRFFFFSFFLFIFCCFLICVSLHMAIS